MTAVANSVLSPEQRNQIIGDYLCPLPGSIPRDNYRPINVPGRFDGMTIFEVMRQLHPHIAADTWRELFSLGRIQRDGRAVEPDYSVRGGARLQHLFPNEVEPDINARVRVIHENAAFIVVSKPAPLPMHPSGRFNRNTLTSILSHVYGATKFGKRVLHPVHRLDANTSGVVLLARNAKAAQHIREQFDRGQVRKTYQTTCIGHPTQDRFRCNTPIGHSRDRSAIRVTDPAGKPAVTDFCVVKRRSDETTELIAQPITGRTNQIRLHLWDAGFPVKGDPLYLTGGCLGESHALPVSSSRMCLHAQKISLLHPLTNKQCTYEDPNGSFFT